MNLAKLLSTGRLEPIKKTSPNGTWLLVGYRRKSSRSRKAGEELYLKTPRPCAPPPGAPPPEVSVTEYSTQLTKLKGP